MDDKLAVMMRLATIGDDEAAVDGVRPDWVDGQRVDGGEGGKGQGKEVKKRERNIGGKALVVAGKARAMGTG